jgi:hypothetical protein
LSLNEGVSNFFASIYFEQKITSILKERFVASKKDLGIKPKEYSQLVSVFFLFLFVKLYSLRCDKTEMLIFTLK